MSIGQLPELKWVSPLPLFNPNPLTAGDRRRIPKSLSNPKPSAKQIKKSRKLSSQGKPHTMKVKGKTYVKITFIEGNDQEHMWVRLTSGTRNNGAGVLDNDPKAVKGVKKGSKIKFSGGTKTRRPIYRVRKKNGPVVELPNPHKKTNGPMWVVLGDSVTLELDDGHQHALGDEWVLATQPQMKSIFLVRRGNPQPDRKVTPAARKAYGRWTAGDDPVGVESATRPNGARVAKMGRVKRVLYTGPLGGNPPKDYVHEFKNTLPVLTEVSDGLIIERAGSRYKVTSRGIVG